MASKTNKTKTKSSIRAEGIEKLKAIILEVSSRTFKLEGEDISAQK
jgi:hypothetical protein